MDHETTLRWIVLGQEVVEAEAEARRAKETHEKAEAYVEVAKGKLETFKKKHGVEGDPPW